MIATAAIERFYERGVSWATMRWIGKDALQRQHSKLALAYRALEHRPGDTAAIVNLAQQLIASGAEEEALRLLRPAVAAQPRAAPLHLALAKALNADGDPDAAVAQADAALKIDPAHREAQAIRVHLLATLGRTKPLAGQDLTSLAAESSSVLAFVTRTTEPEQALALCDRVLADKPTLGDVQYLRALALARLGRDGEAREIIDLERDVAIGHLDASEGLDNDAFRAVLAAEVSAHPSLALNPRGRSASNLSATRDLSRAGLDSVDRLMVQIRAAVDAHEARLDRESTFYRSRPAAARLSLWASVNSGDGRQTSHRHPDGWLSGVYYVTAPRPEGANAYRGPLLLGALEPSEGIPRPPWGLREVEPVPGRLVLFPSYVPHATAATFSPELRVSIAFDVVQA